MDDAATAAEPEIEAPTLSANWSDVQERTFKNWINYHLTDCGIEIGPVRKSLHDGVALIILLEKLSGKKAKRFFRNPNNRIHYFNNVDLALKMVKAEGIGLVNIGAADIVDQNYTATMGLIWELIAKYSVKHSRQGVLDWVNRMVGPSTRYNLSPTRFAEHLSSGKLACCVVDACSPGIIDVDNLPPTPKQRAQLALTKGEEIGIAPVLEAEDMLHASADSFSVAVFFAGCREACPEPPAPQEVPLRQKGLYVEVLNAPDSTITETEGEGHERGLKLVPKQAGGWYEVNILWRGQPITSKPIVLHND